MDEREEPNYEYKPAGGGLNKNVIIITVVAAVALGLAALATYGQQIPTP